MWLSHWKKYPFAKHTKAFYGTPDRSKVGSVLALGRGMLSLFLNFVSGHNNLAYHLSKEEEEVDPGCRYCNTSVETTLHWATNCPTLMSLRTDCFLDIPPCDGEWEVANLVRFIGHQLIRGPLEERRQD